MSENESMVTTKWHFTYSLIPRVVSRHNKMLSFKQFKLALWSLFFFPFGSKNSVHQILESNADGTFCNQTMQLCTFAKPFVIIFKIFPCDKSLVTQSVNIHLLFSGYSFNVILLHKCSGMPNICYFLKFWKAQKLHCFPRTAWEWLVVNFPSSVSLRGWGDYVLL